jgi:hypothetical protein
MMIFNNVHHYTFNRNYFQTKEPHCKAFEDKLMLKCVCFTTKSQMTKETHKLNILFSIKIPLLQIYPVIKNTCNFSEVIL